MSRKTEKPTRKRIIKARREGYIPVSRDVISLLTLTVFFLVLRAVYPLAGKALRSLISYYFAQAGVQSTLDIHNTARIFSYGAERFLFAVLPLGAAVFAAAVCATLIQTRFNITPRAVLPDIKRIDPAKGIRNIFSVRGLWQLTVMTMKIISVILIIFLSLKNRIAVLGNLTDMSFDESLKFIAFAVCEIIVRSLAALTIIAAVDYLALFIKYSRKIKMTKQEVKEEIKEDQMSPQIREAMSKLHDSDASGVSWTATDCDIVICCRGEYAVALAYDRSEHQAPVVIVSGKNSSALAIKNKAAHIGKAVFESPALARDIFMSTVPGQKIQQKYYYAVAELLAQVYNYNNKGFEVI